MERSRPRGGSRGGARTRAHAIERAWRPKATILAGRRLRRRPRRRSPYLQFWIASVDYERRHAVPGPGSRRAHQRALADPRYARRQATYREAAARGVVDRARLLA